MATRVRSHAKINLGLYVGAPRPDGFHGLATVYQTLELFDVVTVTARRASSTAIRLTSNDGRVPQDQRNTAWKMVELALADLGIAAEVEIHIEKRLPVQGGMGAGSANAVAALVGLEAELGIAAESDLATEVRGFPPFDQRTIVERGTEPFGHSDTQQIFRAPFSRLFPGARTGDHEPQAAEVCLPSDPSGPEKWSMRRLQIAAEVGSDVPLFLIGGAVLGSDRGQIVDPLPDFKPLWCVIALPAHGVSTAQAFRDWDALCAEEGLTQQVSHDKLNELSRSFASAFAGISEKSFQEGESELGSSGVPAVGGNLAGPTGSALVRTGILTWVENDFERVVFPQHPSLAEIKRILAGSGSEAALLAMLSGSGSALFGLYQTQGDAEAALMRLREAGVNGQVTRTLPRQAYWEEMLLPQEG